MAKTLGRKNFAVQDGGQCFTEGPWKEKKWRGNHQAYGISDKCENDGKGGPMANQVYGRLDGGGTYFIFDKIIIAKRHKKASSLWIEMLDFILIF